MVVSDKNASQPRRLDRDFERFVVAESPALLRSAYLLTGDRGHAEDLLQTALLRTLRRWDAIAGSPRAYASEVLVNLSRDRRRGLSRRPREVPESEGPVEVGADHPARILERDVITRAARQLPRAQREVLACRFLLDLSVAETAAALGQAEGTVKSYTARALAGLRGLLVDDPTVGRPNESRGLRC
jgi:RNA polymerase sigma-70 factor (sigma-E family)